MNDLNSNRRNPLSWLGDNAVTVLFVLFTLVGFLVSTGVSMNFFLTELSSRFFRNAFLILALIIPVVAGLGLNFGIVVGAMAAQIAVVIVRYFDIGGHGGLLLTAVIAAPLAALFGFFTGLLYNKTKGQEMIASLIVGFFANGLYQFLFLFVIGIIIPVSENHPLIKPDGVGVRMSVDLIPVEKGGLKYALDYILQIDFVVAMIILAVGMLAYLAIQFLRKRRNPAVQNPNPVTYGIGALICLVVIGICVNAIVTNNSLMIVKKVPVVTGIVIILLCIFTNFIMKTKLGQDFRSVGQSRHIAEISGINVDRTRIIATIMSTVLAAWGQLIYLQNMGTLNTYNAHSQIGMFSVAALLVGGASSSKATVKHALIGTLLFNAMFIMSPEIGQAVFGQALLGEYFRTFMVYGVIGVALGLNVWKTVKKSRITIE